MKPLHVSELAAYESSCRTSHTGPDRVAEGWTVADGFVHVNGVRALGGENSKGIVSRMSYTGLCQLCGRASIEHPLALYVRFEHALGRLMFWRGGAESWERRRRYCDGCAPKMAPRGQLALGGVA